MTTTAGIGMEINKNQNLKTIKNLIKTKILHQTKILKIPIWRKSINSTTNYRLRIVNRNYINKWPRGKSECNKRSKILAIRTSRNKIIWPNKCKNYKLKKKCKISKLVLLLHQKNSRQVVMMTIWPNKCKNYKLKKKCKISKLVLLLHQKNSRQVVMMIGKIKTTIDEIWM